MTATFHVQRRFALKRSKLWVLAGTILAGEIHRGMRIRIPRDGSIDITERIHGVEFVDGPANQSLVGLTFRVADSDDYLMWEMFPEVGDVIELEESSA